MTVTVSTNITGMQHAIPSVTVSTNITGMQHAIPSYINTLLLTITKWIDKREDKSNLFFIRFLLLNSPRYIGGHHGRDRMVVGFTATCAISAYHHWSCEFESHSWRGVLNTSLCDKVCHWLATGQWFSQVTLVSSTNKTDRHDITEILLKVALNSITLTLTYHCFKLSFFIPIQVI